jgi:hypothetical protein
VAEHALALKDGQSPRERALAHILKVVVAPGAQPDSSEALRSFAAIAERLRKLPPILCIGQIDDWQFLVDARTGAPQAGSSAPAEDPPHSGHPGPLRSPTELYTIRGGQVFALDEQLQVASKTSALYSLEQHVHGETWYEVSGTLHGVARLGRGMLDTVESPIQSVKGVLTTLRHPSIVLELVRHAVDELGGLPPELQVYAAYRLAPEIAAMLASGAALGNVAARAAALAKNKFRLTFVPNEVLRAGVRRQVRLAGPIEPPPLSPLFQRLSDLMEDNAARLGTTKSGGAATNLAMVSEAIDTLSPKFLRRLTAEVKTLRAAYDGATARKFALAEEVKSAREELRRKIRNAAEKLIKEHDRDEVSPALAYTTPDAIRASLPGHFESWLEALWESWGF